MPPGDLGYLIWPWKIIGILGGSIKETQSIWFGRDHLYTGCQDSPEFKSIHINLQNYDKSQ